MHYCNAETPTATTTYRPDQDSGLENSKPAHHERRLNFIPLVNCG